MPPKAKFTKEQIVEAGLEIIRADGIENLTARALGKKLGSSACPIFTVFESMEEVQAEIIKAAKALYSGYIKAGLQEELAFKGVGKHYILFAIKEPKLFQLLFMTEQAYKPAIGMVLPVFEENYDEILQSVKDGYNLLEEEAKRLYLHLWIYTHGIAALCATKTCAFTAEEIGTMMTEVCKGILKELKGEKS